MTFPTALEEATELLTACPLCRNTSISHFADATWIRSDRHLLELLGLEYVPSRWSHCEGCNHVFLNPRFTADVAHRLYGPESLYREYSLQGRSPLEYMATIDDTVLERKLVHASHLASLRRLQNLTGLQQATVLDFGAGFGAAASAVVAIGWRYYGYELDTWCLERARELGRPVDDHVPGEKVDLAYSSQVFEHIGSPNDVADSIRSALKPDGFVFINVPTHTYDLSRLTNLGRGGPNCMNWGHYHSYTRESLDRMLESWGFRMTHAWLAGGDVNVLAQRLSGSSFGANAAAGGRQGFSTAAEQKRLSWLLNVWSPIRTALVDRPLRIGRELRGRLRRRRGRV